jgi:hypothetical protein
MKASGQLYTPADFLLEKKNHLFKKIGMFCITVFLITILQNNFSPGGL